MQDITAEAEFHQLRNEEMLEQLPVFSKEEMKKLHLHQIQPVVRRRIRKLQDESPPERRRQIWNKGVLAFGPLVLPPEYLLDADAGGAVIEAEDVMLSIGVRNTLANAIYVAGSADADPRFQQRLVSMLDFVYRFIAAHGDDPQARALRRWMNGLKGEASLDKLMVGPCRVFTSPFETDYKQGYKLDSLLKGDRVWVLKDQPNVAVVPDIEGIYHLPGLPFRVASQPSDGERDDQIRQMLLEEEDPLLREIAQTGKIVRLGVTISTHPQHSPEIDLNLGGPGSIIRNYGRLVPEGLIRNGIIQGIRRQI